MAAEQLNNPESTSQQFIDYVTSHADPVTERLPHGRSSIRESHWKVDIRLPLLREAIKEVFFRVCDLTDEADAAEYGALDKLTYDVGIHIKGGLTAYFTYEPNHLKTPYKYLGIDSPGVEAIQEGDLASLLSELKAYEAAGQMTKIELQENERS